MRVMPCGLICVMAWALGAPASAQDADPSAAIRPESWPDGILLVVKDDAGLASNDSPIYFASNWTGWNPGDPAYRLTGRSDLRWQILLSTATRDEPVRFKFTRGSWQTVEIAADRQDITDRALPDVPAGQAEPGKPLVFEFTIPAFADQREGGPQPAVPSSERAIDAVGDVRRLKVVGGGAAARGLTRDALVWLPPGYNEPANATRRYPVLYLHDGQNVFEQLPGVPGEWQADETATRLIAEQAIEPVIIVAIPHSGPNRIAEYIPAECGFTDFEADGEGYVEFLCREVVPRVDAAFRTDARPERRAVGGASLGGLISLYAAMRRPDVFDLALVESPAVYQRGQGLWRDLYPEDADWPRVVFIAAGGRESSTPERSAAYLEQARGLIERVEARSTVVRAIVDPEAAHNESAWAARFDVALTTLFPKPE